MSNILCIDDEPSVGVVLEHHLTEIGHHPVLATSVDEGLKAVREQPFDLIISDYRMPNATGLDLLELLRAQGYEIPVIIMTGYSSIEHAVMSIRHGAVDYLTKPLRQEALRIAVNNAIEVARLRRENEAYRREITSLRGQRTIVGESAALRDVMETIAMVAPTRATVLLEGESGTGKELFARALHEQSPRKDEPFVTVNCAALPEGLVESTLFGHERGAFTGATQRQAGAFERAHRGTLLLDEISEMRLDLQAKLLRAIQEQEFERVGGSQPVRVDVRIVATTNRDLLAEVEAGRFRRDLYYRLAVVPVKTPSLRDRHGDLPRLVEHFVAVTASELGVKSPVVRADALAVLERRPWPAISANSPTRSSARCCSAAAIRSVRRPSALRSPRRPFCLPPPLRRRPPRRGRFRRPRRTRERARASCRSTSTTSNASRSSARSPRPAGTARARPTCSASASARCATSSTDRPKPPPDASQRSRETPAAPGGSRRRARHFLPDGSAA
ncbi:MAG: sigma-54-dependent Fis family transcriptional regulator [Candidatus Eisenbacteria bacterium]|nr:sigma-54-dependent Fis family transcriptional regulator [Candidatus Eisenbacteria bacterium]